MVANPWTTAAVMATFGLAAVAPAEAQLRISAAQGSTRSVNSQAVTLTGIDGAPGFISATTQRPFVTGLIPVVGDYGGAYAPVYGPLSLRPQYRPGPSVVQDRIARLRQEGLLPLPRRDGDNFAFRSAQGRSFAERTTTDRQSRLTAARKSSAGKPIESIAAIRRRQALEDQHRKRERQRGPHSTNRRFD
ncbi:MAG: hypothetical protein WD894_24440 [Pirellulales bacterium]